MSAPGAARHRAITALRAFTRGRETTSATPATSVSATTSATPAISETAAVTATSPEKTTAIAPNTRSAIELCDLCGAGLVPGHDHLVDPGRRELRCACHACALLFMSGGETRFRRVRHHVQHLVDFKLSDASWSALQIPIAMAFFFATRAASGEGSSERVIALFPSPAGATEAWLEPAAWTALVAENPVLATLEPDVEALLVVRLGDARDHFRISIDIGYALVGLLRLHWRGLSGGRELWAEIDRFVTSLKSGSAAHA